jgi:hypothetical protein
MRPAKEFVRRREFVMQRITLSASEYTGHAAESVNRKSCPPRSFTTFATCFTSTEYGGKVMRNMTSSLENDFKTGA